MKTVTAAAFVALLFLPLPSLAAIDCSRARSNVEKLLCSDLRLMRADETMAFAYRNAIRRGVDPRSLIDSQRDWIRDVRDPCADVECMLQAYAGRTADLESR